MAYQPNSEHVTRSCAVVKENKHCVNYDKLIEAYGKPSERVWKEEQKDEFGNSHHKDFIEDVVRINDVGERQQRIILMTTHALYCIEQPTNVMEIRKSHVERRIPLSQITGISIPCPAATPRSFKVKKNQKMAHTFIINAPFSGDLWLESKLKLLPRRIRRVCENTDSEGQDEVPIEDLDVNETMQGKYTTKQKAKEQMAQLGLPADAISPTTAMTPKAFAYISEASSDEDVPQQPEPQPLNMNANMRPIAHIGKQFSADDEFVDDDKLRSSRNAPFLCVKSDSPIHGGLPRPSQFMPSSPKWKADKRKATVYESWLREQTSLGFVHRINHRPRDDTSDDENEEEN